MQARIKKVSAKKRGFTIAETIIVLGIVSFALVSGLSVLTIAFRSFAQAKAKTASVGIANEFLELYRNLPYDQVGTTTGWPPGSIPATQTAVRSGFSFTVKTRVDYMDDAFDGNAAGTIPGKPRDTAPNDYKRMEVRVLSGTSALITMTTLIAPKGLESAANTGSLLLKVFDASGQPVPEASVQITNATTNPQVDIDNTTDLEGNLQILSLPPALESYRVTVSKTGYTADGTESPNGNGYTPAKPDISILAGEVTEASFSIDRTSSLLVKTVDQNCQPVLAVPFRLEGEKVKGTNPDTVKYRQDHSTDNNGRKSLPDLEWDAYAPSLQGGGHTLAGQNPPLLTLQPGSSQELILVLGPPSPHSLLVNVIDAAMGSAVTDATVTISRNGNDATQITGRGFFIQTDWSEGSGQALFSNPKQFWSSDGNIDPTTTAGDAILQTSSDTFVYEETFSSAAYQDASTTAVWDGSGSVSLPESSGSYVSPAFAQTIKINSAAGAIAEGTVQASEQLNGQTAKYFLSNDGGVTFEEVALSVPHSFLAKSGDLRLRIELSTADPSATPVIEDVRVTYSITSYKPSAILESSSFDTGSSSTFQAIEWNPVTQLPQTGLPSIQWQVAANNDNAIWNFTGPDNTPSTFYATSGTKLNASLDNNRYIRYRAALSTADALYSPILSSVAIGYTSGCTPPGQAFFGNLNNADYTIAVTKTGYETHSGTTDVSGETTQTITLTPSP